MSKIRYIYCISLEESNCQNNTTLLHLSLSQVTQLTSLLTTTIVHFGACFKANIARREEEVSFFFSSAANKLYISLTTKFIWYTVTLGHFDRVFGIDTTMLNMLSLFFSLKLLQLISYIPLGSILQLFPLVCFVSRLIVEETWQWKNFVPDIHFCLVNFDKLFSWSVCLGRWQKSQELLNICYFMNTFKFFSLFIVPLWQCWVDAERVGSALSC